MVLYAFRHIFAAWASGIQLDMSHVVGRRGWRGCRTRMAKAAPVGCLSGPELEMKIERNTVFFAP